LILLATSAAGKTTIVKELNNNLVLDGDDIVATTLGGWPKGRWWETMDPDSKTEFLRKVWPAVLNAARDRVVLFGVTPSHVFTETVFDHGYDSGIYVWVPSTEVLTRNVNSRLESGVKNQPNNLDQVLQGRDVFNEFANSSRLVDQTLTTETEVKEVIKKWLEARTVAPLKLKPIHVGTLEVDSTMRHMMEIKFRGTPVLITADSSGYRRIELGGEVDDKVVTLLDPLAHPTLWGQSVKLCEDAFWWGYSRMTSKMRS
jgi:hypothetical protein